VKETLRDLLHSDRLKVELILKSKNDYQKNFFRLSYNKLILKLQRKFVPCHFKNWLLRTTGMHVGHDACVPHDIDFDPYFPELITLGAGCIVGGVSQLITHEVKGKKLILGKCKLAERTLQGGLSTMLPGAVIRKHGILNLYAKLDTVMPEGQLFAGNPAKSILTFNKEQVDKYFKPSNKKYKEYYRDFGTKLKAFRKDPAQNFFKIHYNGKRLNAGDDWWRARNVFRIFYNGAIIELTRLLPHCWLKTLLLRMAGVKIGKRCYIGKGVVFDHIYCDTITLEDNVRLDNYCYFDGHEYTITQTIFGRILIKKGAHLKHHAYVRTGAIIGENTVIEPWSMAQREIPANEVWKGIPAKCVKKR